MKGSEFLATYRGKSYTAWEQAAINLALAHNSIVEWPFTEVQLSMPGHTGVVRVANDYFAIGDSSDFLRLPLTPSSAQQIADALGYQLPTPKLVYETWKAAPLQLAPKSEVPNIGASLTQYQAHNDAINDQAVATGDQLTSGQKKDIVISKLLEPGKVVIYGWFHNDNRPMKESLQSMIDGTSQPIQPRSNAHGNFYVDYSHGIRFVDPDMIVDGQPMKYADVLQDPELSALVSDEGPLKTIRYSTGGMPTKQLSNKGTPVNFNPNPTAPAQTDDSSDSTTAATVAIISGTALLFWWLNRR